MKKLIIIAAVILAIGLLAGLANRKIEIERIGYQTTLGHEQYVWMIALEWCESGGNTEAINEVDMDGTPSYYSWQFKPGTLKYYAVKYELMGEGAGTEYVMEKIADRDFQRQVLEKMINDPGIIWEHEFPGCVKKLGRPPKI
jgi:hypothetical protein